MLLHGGLFVSVDSLPLHLLREQTGRYLSVRVAPNVPERSLLVTTLKTRAMAERLGISPVTLRKWAARGLVPCLKPTPRTTLFDPAAVEAALKKRRPARE